MRCLLRTFAGKGIPCQLNPVAKIITVVAIDPEDRPDRPDHVLRHATRIMMFAT